MAIISEKQDVSSWIPFFEPNSRLNAADRALYISIFQNSVLAGYRNSELVPYAPLNDPTDQALALSLSECGKMAGKLLAAREGERVELHKEQITLIEHQKKLEILHQTQLDQLELSKESLLSRIKERVTLTLQALSSISSPAILAGDWTSYFKSYYAKVGEFERAQYLCLILKTFQDNLHFSEKSAKEITDNHQKQEEQIFSLELAIKEENPARGVMDAVIILGSRVKQLRDSNRQLAQENEERPARQGEELTSHKKNHALFFKELAIQSAALQQSSSQNLPSWSNQAFLKAVARDFPLISSGGAYGQMVLAVCPIAYSQSAASSQHRLTLLCDDVARLAKEADLFTGNP